MSAVLLLGLSLVVHLASGLRTPAFFAAVFLWGAAGWAYPPAQSSHLLSVSPTNAPLVLALNWSALFLGIALGSLVGGVVLHYGTPGDLGWLGALFPAAALVARVLASPRRKARKPRRFAPRLG